jgi:hypothetical protein
MDLLLAALVVGAGATATMDVWGFARERLLAKPRPDYALVGRWLGHMLRGRFRHVSIKAAEPVRGEAVVGWIAHYLIGMAFAALLVGLYGLEWVRQPTLGPALLVGVGTVAVPFLVMQPGMGAGVAARKAPNPRAARIQSLVNHTVFGFGLYAAGWALSAWLAA